MNDGGIIHIDSPECRHLALADPLLGRAMHLIGDFEYSAHPNTEDFFFSTIIGQMMSNTVADVIEGRVSAMCGGKMTADAILSLGIERIRSAGVSMQKAEYMTLFAQKIKSEPKFLDNLKSKSNNEVLKELTALRGIGNWTAKCICFLSLTEPTFYLMRMVHFFKHTDGSTRSQTLNLHL